MTPEVALDILRQAQMLIVLLVLVIISPSLLVGLLVAIFQAATQINEQTLSFLPTTDRYSGHYHGSRPLDSEKTDGTHHQYLP